MKVTNKKLAERVFVVVDKHDSILAMSNTALTAEEIKNILGLSAEASLFERLYGAFGWAVYTVDEDGHDNVFWEHNTNLTHYYLNGKYRI